MKKIYRVKVESTCNKVHSKTISVKTDLSRKAIFHVLKEFLRSYGRHYEGDCCLEISVAKLCDIDSVVDVA
jgi:hypothetical protein